MNSKDAIKKIKDVLGLSFKKESFASTSLTDGTEVTNNLDSEFMIGQVLYVVGESTLTPAPAGTHETREGWKITVDSESVIVSIEGTDAVAEDETTTETTEENMSEESEAIVEETPVDVKDEVIAEVIDALLPLVEEVKALAEEMKKMKTKMEQEMGSLKKDFDSFKKSPEKFSVVEKKTYKESLDDYKLDLIKTLRR
jgi:hypothetical protein